MKQAISILFLFLSITMLAQQDKRQKIKALKVAFITERINLTEKEAQLFWPIYNDYENRINNVRFQDIKSIRKEIRNNLDNMTDEKAEDLLNQLNTAERKLYHLEEEMQRKIAPIISPKKTVLLKMSEEDFKRKMIEEWKKRKR